MLLDGELPPRNKHITHPGALPASQLRVATTLAPITQPFGAEQEVILPNYERF